MKQIFLGSVIRPISLYAQNDTYHPNCLNQDGKDFALISYQFYRNILFQLGNQNDVIDLLYDSPFYPVLGIHPIDKDFHPIIISNPTTFLDNITPRSLLMEQKKQLLQYKELFIPHPKEGRIKARQNDFLE